MLTTWPLLKFQILTFPCSELVGGPLGTGSRLDCLHIFQQRGFHSSSSWAQSVRREEAAALVGPLHPVTWRLSLICSSAFTAAFIFRLPCCFLRGLRGVPSNQAPSPHRSPHGTPGASLLQQRRRRRSPLLLNKANQETLVCPCRGPDTGKVDLAVCGEGGSRLSRLHRILFGLICWCLLGARLPDGHWGGHQCSALPSGGSQAQSTHRDQDNKEAS